MLSLSRLALLALVLGFSTLAARAGDLQISKERQDYLEGVWTGVPSEVSADRLCSRTEPPTGATTLSIEFQRSGGAFFASDGSEDSLRGAVTKATESNGVIMLVIGEEVWRLRPDTDKVMTRVRSSASLGGDVDTMVFKRCVKPADRSVIAIDDAALKLLASDLPGDEAFFIDERLVPKKGDRCAVEETQYLFFALIGPAEFRLSRWNSFALADKMAAKKPVKLPALDPVADWKIETVRLEAGRYVVRMHDYDNEKGTPLTIHVEARGAGITIPEWRRTYVRCTGFQSRS